jgi:hypothetical protein
MRGEMLQLLRSYTICMISPFLSYPTPPNPMLAWSGPTHLDVVTEFMISW